MYSERRRNCDICEFEEGRDAAAPRLLKSRGLEDF